MVTNVLLPHTFNCYTFVYKYAAPETSMHDKGTVDVNKQLSITITKKFNIQLMTKELLDQS